MVRNYIESKAELCFVQETLCMTQKQSGIHTIYGAVSKLAQPLFVRD